MILNLSSGQPSNKLLPNKLIENTTNKYFNNLNKQTQQTQQTQKKEEEKEEEIEERKESSPILAYGDKYYYFSNRISLLLKYEGGRININPFMIVPIAGVSNGLDLLTTLLCRQLIHTNKKGIVFIEDYSYFLSAGIFEDHGLLVISIPTDYDGIIINEFKNILENIKNNDKENNYLPIFLYCIPTFHNPTGRTMSYQRRVELLDLTLEYSIYVIADEVYQLLGFTDYLPDKLMNNPYPKPYNTIQSLYPSLISISSKYNHVISISSFSKILGPGLRVGWIEFSDENLRNQFDTLGVIKSGSNICHFSSYIAVTSILCPEDISDDIITVSNDNNNDDNNNNNFDFNEYAYTICPFRLHLNSLRQILALKYHTLVHSLQFYSDLYLKPYGSSYDILIEGCDENFNNPNNLHNNDNNLHNNSNTNVFKVVGGYFIWVYLPEWIQSSNNDNNDGNNLSRNIMTSERLLEISEQEPYLLKFMLAKTCQYNSSLSFSSSISPLNHDQSNTRSKSRREKIRLCFAKLEVSELHESGKRFCELLRDYQPVGTYY